MSDRIAAQFAFLTEADRLKTVTRATQLYDGSRAERTGEHSWHVALFALTLAEHAPAGIDVLRVLKMLLLHDLVEIDAGDAPIHGVVTAEAPAAIDATEQAAAARIFGLLPADQATAFRALWDEFETGQTPDARFARAVDRVQPVLANLETGGGSWITYGVTRNQLEDRVGTKVMRGAPALWDALRTRIDAWFAKSR